MENGHLEPSLYQGMSLVGIHSQVGTPSAHPKSLQGPITFQNLHFQTEEKTM